MLKFQNDDEKKAWVEFAGYLSQPEESELTTQCNFAQADKYLEAFRARCLNEVSVPGGETHAPRPPILTAADIEHKREYRVRDDVTMENLGAASSGSERFTPDRDPDVSRGSVVTAIKVDGEGDVHVYNFDVARGAHIAPGFLIPIDAPVAGA